MTKLANLGFLRIAGLAAGAAVVSGAAVLVTASAAGYSVPFFNSPPPSSAASIDEAAQASALCTDFISHFSADLNTSQAALDAAFQKAIGETLADRVKNGKLTQAQADKIRARLAGRTPCAIAGALQRPGAGADLSTYRRVLLSAAASALGITDETLKGDLAKGMSFSQIAATQHVTEAQFRTKLIANLTPLLDKAVADKLIPHLDSGRRALTAALSDPHGVKPGARPCSPHPGVKLRFSRPGPYPIWVFLCFECNELSVYEGKASRDGGLAMGSATPWGPGTRGRGTRAPATSQWEARRRGCLGPGAVAQAGR
jgi:hypothetical protein